MENRLKLSRLAVRNLELTCFSYTLNTATTTSGSIHLHVCSKRKSDNNQM